VESGKVCEILNIMDFGAAGDGKQLDTSAIQSAIDECNRVQGRLVFPAGKYLTGTLYIKSGVEIHLENDAVILGSTDIDDYATDTGGIRYANESWMDRCLIYAEAADDISITGKGALDGQGTIENFPPGGVGCDRPMLLRFLNCTNIVFCDFKMRNPAAWGTAIIGCENIDVRNLTIHNMANENGDGLDFDSCQNVIVDNCNIVASDDCICLQASEKDRPCENITITNCNLSSTWAAIRIGLLTRSDIRNVEMRDCHFQDVIGSGFKIQMCEGAVMENMLFKNITMERVTRPLFMTLNSHRFCRELWDEPLGPLGTLRNIKFVNIKAIAGNPTVADEKAYSSVIGVKPYMSDLGVRAYMGIIGVPEGRIENIEFENIEVVFPGLKKSEYCKGGDVPELGNARPEFFHFKNHLPAYGFYIRHVKGITLDNVKLGFENTENRPPIFCDDVEDITVSELKAQCDEGVEAIGKR